MFRWGHRRDRARTSAAARWGNVSPRARRQPPPRAGPNRENSPAPVRRSDRPRPPNPHPVLPPARARQVGADVCKRLAYRTLLEAPTDRAAPKIDSARPKFAQGTAQGVALIERTDPRGGRVASRSRDLEMHVAKMPTTHPTDTENRKGRRKPPIGEGAGAAGSFRHGLGISECLPSGAQLGAPPTPQRR